MGRNCILHGSGRHVFFPVHKIGFWLSQQGTLDVDVLFIILLDLALVILHLLGFLTCHYVTVLFSVRFDTSIMGGMSLVRAHLGTFGGLDDNGMMLGCRHGFGSGGGRGVELGRRRRRSGRSGALFSSILASGTLGVIGMIHTAL